MTTADPPLVFSADLAEVEDQAIGYGLAIWSDPRSGEHLSADVEGLTIADYGRRSYLLASSQGDNTFAVYRRNGANRYLTSFTVAERAVDGVQESDGAAVLTAPLGPDFPGGLLVVQDGDNTPDVLDADGEPRAATNFKYLRWDEVAQAAGLR